MNHADYADTYLRDILTSVRTAAIVGATTPGRIVKQ